MRGTAVAILGVVSIAVGLAGSLVSAASLNLDLSDFNDDAMRGMDDAMKSLDSDITARDAQAVTSDTQSIRQTLAWAQDYFAKKGNFPDAVRWAKEGQGLAEGIAGGAQSNNFDSSLNKYDSLVKTCRACHDAYKPPDI
jgi:hypothetical protein